MRTVLGFDSWTGGASKYARLVPALRARGFRLLLLHIGSWGGDPDRPQQEWLDELEIRDISYYRGRSFEEIIAIERPAAVLFLSNDVFAHRAFNRFSLQVGVPTLRLYHGVVGVQAAASGKLYDVNPISQARFILARIPKALRRVWPCYALALLKTGASLSDWGRFLTDIVNLSLGRYVASAALDCRTSHTAVYTPSDVSHAIKKYGHRPDEVHVVGNPDIQIFGLDAELLGFGATPDRALSNEIIYIDTGLIHAGMVFDGEEDFCAHLVMTRDSFARQGKSLVLKLHPQHFRTELPASLKRLGIPILSNEDFARRLSKSPAAVIEPSSAALIPGLLGIPIFMARYGKLSGQLYGEVLESHPRAHYLDDPDKLDEILERDTKRFNPALIRHWIVQNSGPLPAEQMPARVADLLHEMVASAIVAPCVD